MRFLRVQICLCRRRDAGRAESSGGARAEFQLQAVRAKSVSRPPNKGSRSAIYARPIFQLAAFFGLCVRGALSRNPACPFLTKNGPFCCVSQSASSRAQSFSADRFIASCPSRADHRRYWTDVTICLAPELMRIKPHAAVCSFNWHFAQQFFSRIILRVKK